MPLSSLSSAPIRLFQRLAGTPTPVSGAATASGAAAPRRRAPALAATAATSWRGLTAGSDAPTAPAGLVARPDETRHALTYVLTAQDESGAPLLDDTARATLGEALQTTSCRGANAWFLRTSGTAPKKPIDLASAKRAVLVSAAAYPLVAHQDAVEHAMSSHRSPSVEDAAKLAAVSRDSHALRAALHAGAGLGDPNVKEILSRASTDPAFLRALANPQRAIAAAEAVLGAPSRAVLDASYIVGDALSRYHEHRVVGLENIPATGRCIVAMNHSFVTYDVALLAVEIDRKANRNLRMLGDHAIFGNPLTRAYASSVGMFEGVPEIARTHLDAEHLMGVAPGGMFEAIRPSSEKYQIRWDRRKGFARLALDTQSPIVLAACPRADDVVNVVHTPLTKLVYRFLKMPAPLVIGRFGLNLPKPARLQTVLSKPIAPPELPRPDAKPGDADYDAVLEAFHGRLCDEMRALMKTALIDDRDETPGA